jgi:hypothetical protein
VYQVLLDTAMKRRVRISCLGEELLVVQGSPCIMFGDENIDCRILGNDTL